MSCVRYFYDPWGRLLGCTGTLAGTLGKLNPFRYRGYVYDEETKLYYLRSRYYNPWWGRFVNADSGLYGVTGLLWNNLFAYCVNEPIKHADTNGTDASAVFKKSVLKFLLGAIAVWNAVKIAADAEITNHSIPIDIKSANDKLLFCYDVLGMDVTSSLITRVVEARYREVNGYDYMYNYDCMLREVKEHIHSYIYATGQRDLEINAMTAAYMQFGEHTLEDVK